MRFSSAFLLLALVGLAVLGVWAWFGPHLDTSPPPSSETFTRQGSVEQREKLAAPGSEAGDREVSEAEEQLSRQPMDGETTNLLGRFVQSGQPLPGVRVELWRPNANTAARFEQVRAVQTDRQGGFVFHGLERVTHELRIDGPGIPVGYKVERVRLGVDATRDLGSIEVPVPASLTGRLIDEAGTPIPGLRVIHGQGSSGDDFDRSNENPGDLHSAVSGADGRFVLDGVLAEDYQYFLVENPEYADKKLMERMKPGESLDVGDVVALRGQQIYGRVVGPDGRAVAGALVAPEWYGWEAIQVRKGTRTDQDGRFRLAGVGKNVVALGIRAEGLQHLDLPREEWTEPLPVRLQDVLVLTGRVEGRGGQPAHVTLEPDYGSGSPPSWTHDLLRKPHRVDDDGIFRVEGLAEGSYTIVAEAEGVGATKEQVIEVTRDMEPLILKIIASRKITVVVRDDLGHGIAGAEVVMDPRISEYPTAYNGTELERTRRILEYLNLKILQTTDRDGQTVFLGDSEQPLALAAKHPDYITSSAIYEAGTWPDPVEIVLARGGRIAGTLTDASGRDQFLLGVSITRSGVARTEDSAVEKYGTARVDEQGRFEVGKIPPGSYDVVVVRRNLTVDDDPGSRLLRATPLLGDGTDERTVQHVEARAGETSEVVLDVQPLGRIEGRVFHADSPAAGVVVFAVEPGTRPSVGFRGQAPGWDGLNTHKFVPYTTTREDGSFVFLYAAPGTWEFRAGHPAAPYPTSAVLVRASRHGETLQQNLNLGTATIRGVLAMDGLTERQARWVRAYLFRLESSDTDPLYRADFKPAETSAMMKVELDSSGIFEFPYLPEGDWVLRFVAPGNEVLYGEQIIVQRQLHTERNVAVDLGTLNLPSTVDVEVQVELPEVEPESVRRFPRSFGMWIRKPVAGRERGIFVRMVYASHGPTKLGALEPGTYEIDLFSGYQFRALGLSGESIGDVRELTVRADGSVDPASLKY